MNVWTVGANISQMDSCSIVLWFKHPHILWILLTFLSNYSSLLYFQALHQLYYDPNIENKNLAQKWLMQAQVSPQAWQFCWALLSPDKVQCTHKHLHGHTHTLKKHSFIHCIISSRSQRSSTSVLTRFTPRSLATGLTSPQISTSL